ncbi:MAG: hypothetical protein ACOC44_12150 [Promethearchaeia archaeon]
MSKINIDELLKILPKLIRENDTVKGAIISALSGVIATHDDIVELTKTMNQRFEAMNERMDKRFESLIEQMNKGFEEGRKDRQELRVTISSVSSRSGVKLEELILNMLNEKLIQENIQKSNIARKDLVDQEGQVYYENYRTDVDVVVQDGKTLLMEVKSTADNRDVFDLIKKGELYKLQTGKQYDGLFLLCLEINRTNFEQAIKQGVRVIAGEIT